MFRLVNFDEESEVYRYLSSIASKTIERALDDWIPDDASAADLYDAIFAHFTGDSEEEEDDSSSDSGEPFFKEISQYINSEGLDYWDKLGRFDDDDRIGLEIIKRKVSRMKEKMKDQKKYYTFDLFEEFLFAIMVDFYQVASITESLEEQGIDPEELDGEIEIEMEYETEDEDILETIRVLNEKYDFDEDEAAAAAFAVYRPELMGPDNDQGMFFWDDDYALFFDKGFVRGIRKMVNGLGSALGYEYGSVKGIFTDINLDAPVALIGTEEGFKMKGEAIEGRLDYFSHE